MKKCLPRWQNLILSHFLEDAVDEIVLLVFSRSSFPNFSFGVIFFVFFLGGINA